MSRPSKVNNREITYLSNGCSLEVVRGKDILADIDFNSQDDFDICKDIIFQLESKAAEVLKQGNTIALPYVGRLRKPLVKQEYLKNRNLFKVARSVMSKEDYIEYKKDTYRECVAKINSEDNLKKLRRRTIALNRKKYIQKYKLFGAVIANIWIESLLWLKPVEFNQEIQDVFDEIEANENNNRKINNR
ncbi:MAG: hypothetical protein J6M39_06790 [Lachnospiraceae bacterium]|nr:hypothetical protein [Lachnospiraceae bacterium]